MIHLLAEYTVRPESLAEVRSAVDTFVKAVREHEPRTEYRTFRRGSTRQFVHLMAFEDESAQKRHQEAPYTLRFVERLYPNCIEEPVFTPLTELVE